MWEILNHPVYGKYIIGILSAFTFYMLLKLIGITNKKYKSLWLYYKDGREKLITKMVIKRGFLEMYKIQFLMRGFYALFFLGFLIIYTGISEASIPLGFRAFTTIFSLTSFLISIIDLLLHYRILRKVYIIIIALEGDTYEKNKEKHQMIKEILDNKE
ncbi:hypothetical protein [Aquimarina sp. 2201CG14-23]|uniref:hypothetical protein n=1 Tax=Aquimarina mycalae TaxID=3040073 RepID=UPI0024780BF5|nr:hypothetical protein [Aquimarina sp. 2201CG14-23]MDH7444668.1 hypothetical protein [Aquimarina sp. 2201CG14-23]